MDLNIIWFILVAVLLTGYAITDGYDLGVGIASLFTQKSENKRILMNAIGPHWDGNVVWLLTGGGAIFAAFPHVYASVFSGLYLALMLVLFMMILRGTSLEFRSKVESASWHNAWELIFGISSLVLALLLGVALGNVAIGLPVDVNKAIHINLFQLLMPYPVIIGLLTVLLFTLHGTLFALNKSTGELVNSLKNFFNKVYWIFLIVYILATLVTFVWNSSMIHNFNSFPVWYVIPIITLVLILLMPSQVKKDNFKMGFTYSFIIVALLMITFAIGIFPNVVPSSLDPNYSLNIYNASSSQTTLLVMLIIAIIGMPFVIGYTIWAHKVFSGKVKIEENSY
jgi:cytochrome d ubiquinol oxidase subunit II